MTADGLPHRAKPRVLHEICRFVRENRGADKSEIYDNIDDNQKTVRRTLHYGTVLGFLKQDEDHYSLADRGTGISYSSTFEGQEAIISAFREAITDYEPYRDAIITVYDGGNISSVKGSQVIERDAFTEALERSVGYGIENREVNVLIKTAEAAGLGEYIIGRRGKQTRLVLDNEFEGFAEELTSEYPLPSKEVKEEEVEDHASEKSLQPDPGQQALNDAETVASDSSSGQLSITVQLDISDKSEKEIAKIIKRIQRGDV